MPDIAAVTAGREPTLTPEQTCLVDRVRTALADEPVVREDSMFGGRSFLVREKLAVWAGIALEHIRAICGARG